MVEDMIPDDSSENQSLTFKIFYDYVQVELYYHYVQVELCYDYVQVELYYNYVQVEHIL